MKNIPFLGHIITTRLAIENNNKTSFLKKLIKYLTNPSLVFKKLFYEFSKHLIEFNWEQRAKKFGKSSVLSYNFSKKEYELITQKHKNIIFPILHARYKKTLIFNPDKDFNSNKNKILDFGCGHGRFSYDLAKKFNASVLGVDKSKSLLKLTKNTFNVKFIHEKQFIRNKIYKNNYFDLVFLFSVLGGIPNNKIKDVAKILIDSLKFNGLIFFIEQTGSKNLEGIWRTRTLENYYKLFNKVNLKSSNYFIEDGYSFSIFEGIKKTPDF
jgi:2-polyprenyl-3-methyl-5-hydroxy-6-metoxy-1,4-benzoquinol methylase